MTHQSFDISWTMVCGRCVGGSLLLASIVLFGCRSLQSLPEVESHALLRRLSRLDPKSVQVKRSSTYVLHESIKTVEQRMSEWLESLPDHFNKAKTNEAMQEITHARFFPFEPMATCKDPTLVGAFLPEQKAKRKRKDKDPSKLACGLSIDPIFQQAENCVIYSVGSNNNFRFEHHILALTQCQVHTFDCTGPLERFTKQPQNERFFFHHQCLADRYIPPSNCSTNRPEDKHALCGESNTLQHIQQSLGHNKIALLKMDIEGFEIPILQSWWHQQAPTTTSWLPPQLLVELHYTTGYAQIIPNDAKQGQRGYVLQTAQELVTLQKMLLELGYVVVAKNDNELCPSCTEVTLIRTN